MNFGLPAEYLTPIVFLHLLLSACMTGVVWAMHTVHYPLMRRVPPERFAAFMEEHLSRSTRWIAPLMVLELATAIALGVFSNAIALLNFMLLANAYTLTVYMRPLYQQLSEGHKPELVERLISLNRYRTILWIIHLAVVILIALGVLILTASTDGQNPVAPGVPPGS